MTSNVITIPSDTPVLEAERMLEFHKFERLPVVDKGKLVGLVTKDTLLRASPSSATSLSRGELQYLLSKLTVKDIMKKKVVTVSPDITIEQATAIAQQHKVGCVPVLEGDRVVGILTTNDIFYKIVNPLLGISESGKRILVHGAGEPEQTQKVMEAVRKSGIKVKTFCSLQSPGTEKNDFILHLDAEDISQLTSQLKEMGLSVDVREHTP
ncbi:MAG: CBS domain-containing protein [Deltaproteobacteria bacterium]|nr:MAG: CBS domain-containing protein [Deltaproteobacteria bacterium]